MLKEVQSLNGKLASLNRFLSKFEEKSFPFFKTLKNYLKKSDFQWTLEAEKAFQDMKRSIAELPMVTATRPKDELIVYLCAAREAISAVLPNEKRFTVNAGLLFITDQPIKQILSRPKNARRILKWRFELEAFNINYRPRTSIRGQVLADIISERPDENGPLVEVQVKETIPDPWTLFMDGSSCP
nr:hypothetical protein [Tanacetum cinerariifolium]